MPRIGAVVLCAALVAVAAGVAAAQQSIEGNWQGTLEAGKSLRLVIRVTAAGGGLGATMFSIDQGAQGFAASAVTVRGTAVTFTFDAIGASFGGTMSSDGRSISGTWRQGAGSLPLTLVRATPDTAWALPAPPRAMAADAPAVFEVATVKPSTPGQPGKLLSFRGRQLLTINTTVNDLITFSYGVQARQIIGGAAWMAQEMYDLTAQPEAPGQPSQAQLRAMIRALLADRFQLTLHRETREMPVYALVVAPGGPKPALAKNDTNRTGLPGLLFRAPGVLPAVNATLADLAGVLQAVVLDRPVVDRTSLPDRYDFTLTWTPDETQFAALGPRPPTPADPNGPPGLFTAIQEQLGIRLDSTRAPVDALVIDKVERPTAN
jgi:uncharacterized protein (TIGR03435 family)